MNDDENRRSTNPLFIVIPVVGVILLVLLAAPAVLVPWFLMSGGTTQWNVPPSAGEVVLAVKYDNMRPEGMNALKRVLQSLAKQYCAYRDEAETIPVSIGHEAYSGFGNDGYVRVTFAPRDDAEDADVAATLDAAVRDLRVKYESSRFEPQVIRGPMNSAPRELTGGTPK